MLSAPHNFASDLAIQLLVDNEVASDIAQRESEILDALIKLHSFSDKPVCSLKSMGGTLICTQIVICEGPGQRLQGSRCRMLH